MSICYMKLALKNIKYKNSQVTQKMNMKIKTKAIESVRIRKDRAELLKNKAIELTIESGIQIQESDLVNFLIDEKAEKIKIHGDTLSI
jgi:hypothetical protein